MSTAIFFHSFATVSLATAADIASKIELLEKANLAEADLV